MVEAGVGLCYILVVLILLYDLFGAIGILHYFDDLAFGEKVAVNNSIFLCSQPNQSVIFYAENVVL